MLIMFQMTECGNLDSSADEKLGAGRRHSVASYVEGYSLK